MYGSGDTTRTDEAPDTLTWVRLKKGNDWMALFVMHPKCKSATSGTHDYKDGLNFEEGASIRVKWAGTVHKCVVTLRKSRGGSYGDMGHTYEYEGSWLPWTHVDGHLHKLTDLEVAEEDLPPWKA